VRRFVCVASPPSGDTAARKVRRIDARDRPVADAQRPSADIHGAGAAMSAAPCAPAPFRCVPSRRQPPEMIGDVGGSDRRRLLRDGDRSSSCNDAAHAPTRRVASNGRSSFPPSGKRRTIAHPPPSGAPAPDMRPHGIVRDVRATHDRAAARRRTDGAKNA